MTPEQIQEHEKLRHKVESGNIEEADLVAEVSRNKEVVPEMVDVAAGLLLIFVVVGVG